MNELAQTPKFAPILEKEAKARGYNYLYLLKDCKDTDSDVSKWLRFRGGPITIRSEDFTSRTLAMLVAFFRLQSTWPHSLDWTEETSYEEKEGEKEVEYSDWSE